METKELFIFITSQPKWYANIPVANKFMTTQAANRIKARFNNGSLSTDKIKEIFNHFGYYQNELWEKK